ncbi:MAG: LytR family transcriptional regulator [Ruminococcaceae bacterium]|nr:LytR family transcriptional regulator [Oscillospiraceae bacterium]
MEENNKHNQNNEFDDIISDTSKIKTNNEDDIKYFDTFSDSKYFKKNRHGIKKILAIGDWWRERKKWQKAVMISALCCVLVFAIIATVIFTVFDYNYNKITNDPENLGFESVIDEKIINVALFGIDTRDRNSFKGLSDSIMVLSLNTETKTVKIISVMRDSLVPITYKGKTTYGKINSAYQKGGPELAIKTLNTIFDLDISEYATVNFFGMADIIEAVGGIDAELTKQEVTRDYGINTCIDEICSGLGVSPNKYYIKTAGKHHLNGIQAVAYSRIRYVANIWGTNNDYGRTDRQRYVMEQLFNKALTLNKSKYMGLAKALIPCAETSLSYSDIMGLATSILLHSPTFKQTRVPLTEYQTGSKYVSGAGSCVYYDLDYASKLIHAFIYDDITQEDYMEENGVEKKDWYKGSSGGSGNSKKPSNSGSGNSGTGTNNSGGDNSGSSSENSGGSSSDSSGGSSSDSSGGSSSDSSGGSSSDSSSGSSSDSSGGSSSDSSGGSSSDSSSGSSSDSSSGNDGSDGSGDGGNQSNGDNAGGDSGSGNSGTGDDLNTEN